MFDCLTSFVVFVTVGGLPPRELEVAHKLPIYGEPWEVCAGCASPPQGKKLHSGSEEVVKETALKRKELKKTCASTRSSTESTILCANSSTW